MTVVVIEGIHRNSITSVHLFPDRETAEQVMPDALHIDDIDNGDPIPLHIMADVERSTQRHALQLLEHLSQS